MHNLKAISLAVFAASIPQKSRAEIDPVWIGAAALGLGAAACGTYAYGKHQTNSRWHSINEARALAERMQALAEIDNRVSTIYPPSDRTAYILSQNVTNRIDQLTHALSQSRSAIMTLQGIAQETSLHEQRNEALETMRHISALIPALERLLQILDADAQYSTFKEMVNGTAHQMRSGGHSGNAYELVQSARTSHTQELFPIHAAGNALRKQIASLEHGVAQFESVASSNPQNSAYLQALSEARDLIRDLRKFHAALVSTPDYRDEEPRMVIHEGQMALVHAEQRKAKAFEDQAEAYREQARAHERLTDSNNRLARAREDARMMMQMLIPQIHHLQCRLDLLNQSINCAHCTGHRYCSRHCEAQRLADEIRSLIRDFERLQRYVW